MHCIIGLGNPGSRYEGTRHNIGFEVVDRIAHELRLNFKAGKGEHLIAQGSFGDIQRALIKPLTYMNESGTAVSDVREMFDIRLEELLIVCDDFQLPLGQLRLRPNGSDGGHNGLYSVIYQLQSDQFPRLRCGIASATMPQDKSLMADFVLETFTKEELPAVKDMIERATEASLSVIRDGLTKAMNVYNTKQTN